MTPNPLGSTGAPKSRALGVPSRFARRNPVNPNV